MIKIPVQVNPSTLVNIVLSVSPLSSQYLKRTDDRGNADKMSLVRGVTPASTKYLDLKI